MAPASKIKAVPTKLLIPHQYFGLEWRSHYSYSSWSYNQTGTHQQAFPFAFTLPSHLHTWVNKKLKRLYKLINSAGDHRITVVVITRSHFCLLQRKYCYFHIHKIRLDILKEVGLNEFSKYNEYLSM